MRVMPVRKPPSTLERMKNFLKKYKLISRGLTGLSHVLPNYASPLTGLSGVAGSLGFGRRRKRRVHRKRVGGRKRVVRRVVRQRKRRVVRKRKIHRRRK